jgi:ubiquinone/menaquinone biosynthesis C-methylase UbiE
METIKNRMMAECKKNNNKVCPVERVGGLDNPFRRLLQNPEKILRPFVSRGMTVLDFGCGPGFFSIEIAKILQNSGKVIAADLQEGMLEKVSEKIKGTALEKTVEIYQCENTKIGITEKVDFILAFWVIHEVPNPEILFDEFKSILKPDGRIFLIEPKFHVLKKDFERTVALTKDQGFEVIDRPSVCFSRSVVLIKKK